MNIEFPQSIALSFLKQSLWFPHSPRLTKENICRGETSYQGCRERIFAIYSWNLDNFAKINRVLRTFWQKRSLNFRENIFVKSLVLIYYFLSIFYHNLWARVYFLQFYDSCVSFSLIGTLCSHTTTLCLKLCIYKRKLYFRYLLPVEIDC